MGKLLGLEILLMLVTGLFAMLVIPALVGYPPAWPLFVVGFLMAMSYVGLYALANMAGRKMPGRARVIIGLMAYLAAFWGDLAMGVSTLQAGGPFPGATLYLRLAPALFGLVPAAVAALRSQRAARGETAAWALYAYAFAMLGVRYLLVPLVRVNWFAPLIAVQAGAIYLLLRGLLRIFLPTAAEGNAEAGPLVRRAMPDRIAGLVEGTTRRHARPFATRADGTFDESAISILCRPEDVPGVQAKLQEALTGQPFAVESGQAVEGKVELVIRPQTPQA